ncbi:hypothetical protein Tco_0130900, partial [Tanacetum coccineum]
EKFLKIVGYEGGVTYATKFLIKHLNHGRHLVNNHHVDYERIIWNDLVIPDEFLTREIKKTELYKDYDVDYNVSLAKTVRAKEAEEKENVASVEKAIIAEEVEKMLKGYEEDDSEFLDSLLLSQEDPDTRLEHGSYKKSPEEKKDVDDDHHHHI